MDIRICITDLFSCTPEMNTALLVTYNRFIKKCFKNKILKNVIKSIHLILLPLRYMGRFYSHHCNIKPKYESPPHPLGEQGL